MQTRLFPAVLCLLAPTVSIAAWIPDFYKLATGLAGSLGVLAAALFLTHLARHRGRAVERKMFSEWGGAPTSLWLRHTDDHLESQTKQRYCGFLESRIAGWQALSEELEERDENAALQSYDTAVRWLREYTRDTKQFPLINKENISYGFRRNSLGLKPYGVTLAAFSIAGNLLALYLSSASLGGLEGKGLVAMSVSVISLAAWISVVRERWARDAADGYARALLAACEQRDR